MSPGTVLAARYELRTPIGRGGMGEVWVGYDRVLSRQVALKVLDMGGTPGPEAVERFRREATASAAITHPHVVTIHDAGVEDGRAYLVMELLSGPTVGELVRERGRLDAALAVDLARQAAEGLNAVHRVGVVHRDVKPSNLMLDDRSRLKVVDFGIARLAEVTAPQVTATGSIIGSAAFLSPEQAVGKPATAASDYYALGCVLMAMLTGQPPFTAEHPMALLRQHVSDPPPRARDRRPDLPPWVDEVVAQLLAKDPAVRRAGFVALLADQHPASADGRTAILPPPPIGGPPHSDQTAVLPMAGGSTGISPRRRRLLVPAVLALAGVALAAVITAIVLTEAHRNDGAAPSTNTAARTTATSTPTPTPSPSPVTASPTPPQSFAAALDSLARTIEDVQREGGIDDHAAKDLQHKVDDLRKSAEHKHGDGGDNQNSDGGDHGDHGNPSNDLVNKLNDLDNTLGELQGNGQLDAAGAARIHQAIDAVRAAA